MRARPISIALIAVFLILSLPVSPVAAAEPDFPSRPVRLVVYTAPGGLIDLTARKLAQIIKQDHPDLDIIVENKKGAGGMVALAQVVSRPADGHTVLGLTSSLVSKAVAVRQESRLEQLHYVARVIQDYECLITQRTAGLSGIAELIADANQLAGRQRWVGPAAGGTDHLFARRVWKNLGIEATWIPYKGGGEAIAALLGGHGRVYVGNPHDVAGRPDLRITAISSPERLAGFPEAPTFEELGHSALTGEVLWRGFAVRRGTPPAVVQRLTDLFRNASESAEWRKFVQSGGMVAVFDTAEDFRRLVAKQVERDRKLLG